MLRRVKYSLFRKGLCPARTKDYTITLLAFRPRSEESEGKREKKSRSIFANPKILQKYEFDLSYL